MTNNRIQRYTVSGDIAYPIHEDPEGDYVTYEDHVAAIKADRQRRGEPVAWIQRSYLNLIRESNVALHNVVVRGSILDGDGDVVPLFTAPQPAESCASLMSNKTACGSKNGNCDSQPAEPVKVPSNTDIDELSREWGLQSAAYPSKSMVRDFARALLARYGKGAP